MTGMALGPCLFHLADFCQEKLRSAVPLLKVKVVPGRSDTPSAPAVPHLKLKLDPRPHPKLPEVRVAARSGTGPASAP